MTTSSNQTELKKDISSIEAKRKVLEEIVTIAKAVENMQESLESVLFLGLPSQDLPKEALELYGLLNENLQSLSVNQIKEYVTNLERVIKKQIGRILDYSRMDLSSNKAIEVFYAGNHGEDENPLQLLEEFKRTAQTTVSLRVLLKKRWEYTEGSPLPVSEALIQKQIEQLDAHDKKLRIKVKTQIVEMKQELDKIIHNANYPDAIKDLVIKVQKNLNKDLASIESGGELSRLNFVIDVEEISGIQMPSAEDTEPAQKRKGKKEVGFTEAAHRWLNSPWDVSWNDAKKSD